MLLESVSQSDLTTRRKKLRRNRRLKSFQTVWRSLAIGGLAGTLVWVCTLPDWVIRKPEQITVEGNRLLSKQVIRSLLPVSYPGSLLRLHPQEIAQKLESQPPIAKAIVTRQLLPPSLTIQIQERQPIAIAQASTSSNLKSSAVGLLDLEGVWIPLKSYTTLNPSFKLPNLKIIGSLSQYKPYWSELYQTVSRSPVKVFEIDCSNPANLILKTQLGNVHFGAYSSRFPYQLSVLDRMRELPNRIKPNKIIYIDLKNPDSPSVQMTKVSNTAKTDNN